MKRIVFAIKCDVFPFTVVFCVGRPPTVAEAGRMCWRHRLWNKTGTLPYIGNGLGSCYTFPGGTFVWLRHRPTTPEGFETYVHELMHVITNASKTIGEYPAFEADELHAYLAGWITRKFMEKIRSAR